MRLMLKMEKIHTQNQFLFAVLFLVSAVLFFWFCWPAVFKGILNVGNLCGMLGCAALLYYAVCHKAVHRRFLVLWRGNAGRIFLLLILVLFLLAAVLLSAAAYVMVHARSKHIPADTPAIVLGCSVIGTRPSRILQERIDAAYAYMQEHPQAVCILSGGKGSGEDISEAECMYRELVAAGVKAERLYQEASSTNTQQNLERSKTVLDAVGNYDAVTVISSDFHLYRGKEWARALGYQQYGYAARTDWKYLPTFFVREMIAVVALWGNKSLQWLW